jgi:hypothetical protein
LYDIARGTFPGNLVLPETDPCKHASSSHVWGRGFKVLLSCVLHGELVFTFYDTLVPNITGKVEFALTHGIKVEEKRTKNMFRQTGEDLYTMPVISRKRHICAYLKVNNYRSVEKLTKQYMKVIRVAFINNPMSDTLVYLFS